MSLVVVTGAPGGGRESLAQAVADRLGRFWISFGAIEDGLAAGAAETPRHWLREDAEQ